ncbi:MAG: 4Fe-4S dicluster domain-containing protein [Candidatus Omnitrophota bacterium]|nr:4Fe-4S dicluster domain-containing protein [Candidatus Omnitrophota bacterium]
MAEKEILPSEIYNEIKETFKKCYGCSKCVSGCPVAEEMDYSPSLMIRSMALGNFGKILASNAIWVCSSCQNCYSRCPFEINIPHIIDLLKEYANKNRLSKKEMATRLFHQAFLSCIRRSGRIHEAALIAQWKMRSGKWFSDIGLGMRMFFKGKLSPFPEKVKRQKEIEDLFK